MEFALERTLKKTKVARDIVAKIFDVTLFIAYRSFTLDEDLHEHINHELADDVGRASDTS